MPAIGLPSALTIGRTIVVFAWRRDRLGHEVVSADGTAWRSVEGPEEDGDPRWPPSPPLVELSRLDGPSGPAFLCVGRAGRSHFSASIGADAAHPDAIRFEIACRMHDQPAWIGSTYRTTAGIVRVEPIRPPPALPATVEWGYSLSSRGILPLAGSRLVPPPAPEV
ncbi:MAG: hypothetical protein EBR28_14105 [Planctomycetia bacterium]|nr:hypothetical protein [Planctomycetia bacterium]